jgi:hypothetical protein
MLTALWKALFQLVMSPFNWIDKGMEEVEENGEPAGALEQTMEVQADQAQNTGIITRLTRKYIWWAPNASEEEKKRPAYSRKSTFI